MTMNTRRAPRRRPPLEFVAFLGFVCALFLLSQLSSLFRYSPPDVVVEEQERVVEEQQRVVEQQRRARAVERALLRTRPNATTTPSARPVLPSPIEGVSFRTTPFDLEFVDDVPLESNSHCFGSTLQKDAWRASSCVFENLCYDVEQKVVLYFSASSKRPHQVSLSAQNYKWPYEKYHNSTKWLPLIVNTTTAAPPRGYYRAPKEYLFVPYRAFVASNVMHFVMDDLFAIFQLTQLAFLRFQTPLQPMPLWLKTDDDPPWASCDWTRLHSGKGHKLRANYESKCDVIMKKWFFALTGVDSKYFHSFSKFPQIQKNSFAIKKSNLICFEKGAAGLGALSDHGFSLHGFKTMKPKGRLIRESLPTGSGRGKAFWDFRRHALAAAGIKPQERTPQATTTILLAGYTSNRLRLSFFEQEKFLLSKGLSNVVRDQTMAKRTPREQMLAALRADVYVTVAGGGAIPALFMRPNTKLILYHESKIDHSHEGFVDFGLFLNLPWLDVVYIDSRNVSDLEALYRHVVG